MSCISWGFTRKERWSGWTAQVFFRRCFALEFGTWQELLLLTFSSLFLHQSPPFWSPYFQFLCFRLKLFVFYRFGHLIFARSISLLLVSFLLTLSGSSFYPTLLPWPCWWSQHSDWSYPSFSTTRSLKSCWSGSRKGFLPSSHSPSQSRMNKIPLFSPPWSLSTEWTSLFLCKNALPYFLTSSWGSFGRLLSLLASLLANSF